MSLASLKLASAALKSPIMDYQKARFNAPIKPGLARVMPDHELNESTIQIYQAVDEQEINLGFKGGVGKLHAGLNDYKQLSDEELLVLVQSASLKADQFLGDLLRSKDRSEISRLSINVMISTSITLVLLDLLVAGNKNDIKQQILKKTSTEAGKYYGELFKQAKNGSINPILISQDRNAFMLNYVAASSLLCLKQDGNSFTNDLNQFFSKDYSGYTAGDLYSQSAIYLTEALRIATGIQDKEQDVIKRGTRFVMSQNYSAQYLTYLALKRKVEST